MYLSSLCMLVALMVHSHMVNGVELTFELPDNSKECFHEVIDKGVKCTFEYQVISGGNYDVDVEIKGPGGRSLYKEVKRQYDNHEFTTEQRGEYTACFSNEFSTFAHKVVYFDFQVGDEPPIMPGTDKHQTALTMMETSVGGIHENLNSVDDFQTHLRLRETMGRSFAEDLNERVQWWSAGLTVVILIVGIGQVLVLRSFFTDKKSSGVRVHGTGLRT